MDGYLSKPFSVDELYVTLKPYDRKNATRARAPEPIASAASAPNATGATLDEQALHQIRSLRQPGGPDLLKKIVDLYISNSRTLVETLREALIRSDAPAVSQAAHSLKSSSANVGATALTQLCAQMETSAKGGKLDSGWPLLDRMVEEHNRVLLALNAQTAAA